MRMRTRFLPLALTLLLAPALGAQDDRAAGLFAEARQLPLVSQALHVRIVGGEATVEVVQVFANDGDELAQADYRLHLPDGATVSGFGFWRGDEFLAAELKEKDEAVAAHAAAAGERRATALLQREGTIHSFSVFPIAAGALQRIATTIRMPVVTERGRSCLRLPVDVFLGHAELASTAVVDVETDEPLRALGVEGAAHKSAGRGERWARLALSSRDAVEVWWAEEAPPLLVHAEAVPLGDGSFALQTRIGLNDAGRWRAPFERLVVLVDTSFSLRRRSTALARLVDGLLARSPAPVAFWSVAETALEIDSADPDQVLRRLLSGEAGFRASWEELRLAALRADCHRAEIRCLAVTDPQIDGLADPDDQSFGTILFADADELAYFADALGPEPAVYQPDVDPEPALDALVGTAVLPVLEVVAIDQAGGTLEPAGPGRARVAEGSLLRLFARTYSTAPLALRLAVDDHALERAVVPELVDPASRQGRAIRRGYFARRLDEWSARYRTHRDPDLRRQIVDVSLREGIPTDLTALHAAAPAAALPAGGTAAPLARGLGLLLLLAGTILALLGRRRA